MADRQQLVRDNYEAFASGDRERVEALLAEDLRFHAPPDPDLDRRGYFERCWPGAGGGQSFEFKRIVEEGETVIVTYEMQRADGGRGRNTEVFTFDADDRIREIEVYFGWDLDPAG